MQVRLSVGGLIWQLCPAFYFVLDLACFQIESAVGSLSLALYWLSADTSNGVWPNRHENGI
jgi:hypothetical protein